MTLQSWIELVGPERAVQVFGIRLVGVSAETGRKVLLSVLAVAIVALAGRGLQSLLRRTLRDEAHVQARFWWRQTIRLVGAGITLLLLLSIWFDQPARLATAAGLVGAGLAVYWRLTDNWLELSVRFVAPEHGVRQLKDAISRDVLAGLDAAGIPIASATYEIVGLPPVRLVPPQPGEAGP